MQRKQETYKVTGTSPTAIELHRELNALKQTAVPWMYAVSKCAPQEALRNLDSAFSHFFRRAQLKQQGQWRGKRGYLRFKTRKRGLGSFRLTGSIVVLPDAIQLPRLGRLRLKERGYLPILGVKVLSATVFRTGRALVCECAGRAGAGGSGQYWHGGGCSPGRQEPGNVFRWTIVANPRHVKRRLKRITRFHRTVSRKVKGSKNRKKTARRPGRLYRSVSHQRNDTLHQLTASLAKTKSVIVIEDLHVAGMLKSHHLAQSIADVGFGEFRRQLAYKSAWYGSRVVLADRWEPSSKACSVCGWYDGTLNLKDRMFHCRNPQVPCGLVLDRDLNAAIQLVKLAGSSSDNANACGEERSGPRRRARVIRSPMKQEADAV